MPINSTITSSPTQPVAPQFRKLKLRTDRYVLTAFNGAVRKSFASLEERAAASEMIAKRRFTSAIDFVNTLKAPVTVASDDE